MTTAFVSAKEIVRRGDLVLVYAPALGEWVGGRVTRVQIDGVLLEGFESTGDAVVAYVPVRFLSGSRP